MNTVLEIINPTMGKTFSLFGQEISFTAEQVGSINLSTYFRELGKKYSDEFLARYDSFDCIANDKENFQNTCKITADVVDEMCDEVNKLWNISEITVTYTRVITQDKESYMKRHYQNKPIYYSLKFPYHSGDKCDYDYTTKMYEATKIGTVEDWNNRYNELKEIADENAQERKNRPSGHTDRWVGGGYGVDGAIKGAMTAGALNMTERAFSGIGKMMSDSRANAKDRRNAGEIAEILDNITATDMELYRNIDEIAQILFIATVVSFRGLSFSYADASKKLEMFNDFSDNMKKQKIIESIRLYPFLSATYTLAEKCFPEETENIKKLKNTFIIPYRKTTDRNLDKERARKIEISTLMTNGYTYEEGKNFEAAISCYKKLLLLDPTHESARYRLGVLEGEKQIKKPKDLSHKYDNVDLYNTFIDDYTLVSDKKFVEEGLENAKKINELCVKNSYDNLDMSYEGRINKGLIEILIEKPLDKVTGMDELVYVPKLKREEKCTISIREFVFINGITVAYRRRCGMMLSNFYDVVYTKSRWVVKDNLEEILNNCYQYREKKKRDAKAERKKQKSQADTPIVTEISTKPVLQSQTGVNGTKVSQPVKPQATHTVSQNKNKNIAALLAILFGGIGLHHFYMGKYIRGILSLLLCWTYIPAAIGLIQGVIYIAETQEKFNMRLSSQRTNTAPVKISNKKLCPKCNKPLNAIGKCNFCDYNQV